MTDVPRLQTYHFYEREWEGYDHLTEEFEWELPDQFNIANYACDRWADDEDRVALYTESAAGETSTYTFADLREASDRLANYLADEGVERGDRVGVNTSQRVETVLTHLAVWKLGGVTIPLSVLFGERALSYRLDDSDATACVVGQTTVDTLGTVYDELESLDTVLTAGDVDDRTWTTPFWDAVEDSSSERDVATTTPDDDAFIIYTSGTTGDPKGVRHGHRVLLGHLPMFVAVYSNMDISKGEVYWTPSEWSWVASLLELLFPALFYGCSVVGYDGGSFDAEKTFALLERYDVTSFFAPPTALRRMMRVERPADRYDIGTVRVIPSGGESLGQSIANWAAETFDGAAVHEVYGQTEANVLVGECTALMPAREGTMGRPGPGHEVTIRDPETHERIDEPDTLGEIAVRYEGNPICFKEYWNEPEKTAKKVHDGWLLTEDLGKRDADDYFTFHSRMDDVIISAGYRIGPEEIEETLTQHDGVVEAGVIGVPDDDRGEVPKAYVVLDDDYGASESLGAELGSYVKDKLAKYEYPRTVEVVDELPTTSTGKIRRTTLEEWHEND